MYADAELIEAVVRDDRYAWVVLLERVRPPMEEWAWRAGVPREDWPECIDEVIEDVVLRLRGPSAKAPAHLLAYFLEAARLRYRMILRGRQTRLTRLVALADGPPIVGASDPAVCAETVVMPLTSEYSRRGAGSVPEDMAPALARMATWVRDQLGEVDQRILGWQAYGVPHRRIAEWLGTSYDAATKRVWRLTRKARDLAERYATELAPNDDQLELARFFRRARGGASATGVLTPPPLRRAPARGPENNRSSPKEGD
jgi:hypothetical protein